MGVLDIVPAGVLTGDNVRKLFDYAKEHKFAIPAINVTSSSTANAALEAARDIKSPIIIQVSQGGSAYFAGKGLANDKQQASITGAVAAAHHIRTVSKAYGVPVVLHSDHCAKKLLPWFDGMLAADEEYFKQHQEPLFSSHMLDLSEEPKDQNIATCVKYFKRMAPIGIWLEMEIGITGGEEDGVDNTGVDNNSLYTQPEDVYDVYAALSQISPNFSIAAAFGNVHGVYKPGNVRLHPELLAKHQLYTKEKIGGKVEHPLFLVFHGGSGSTKQEIKTAVQNGVVKMNVDTDTQFAYLAGIRDFVLNKKDYLLTQVGNPEGSDKPNKKFYDPRIWVREGEKTLAKRVQEACADLGNIIPNSSLQHSCRFKSCGLYQSLMNALRQPLRAALKCRYTTAAPTTPFVPPAALQDVITRKRREKRKPESPTFYTGRSDFFDQVSSLETAVQHARRSLTLLQLLPLPAFARASLPPAQPVWRNREDMSALFARKLTTSRYRRILTLLSELEEYQRIAGTAGHQDFREAITAVLQMFERSDKAAVLARGKRKPVQFDKYGRTCTVGKRKESTARVWMIPVQQPKQKAVVVENTPAQPPNGLYSLEPVVDDAFARTPTSHPKVNVTTTTILVNNLPLNQFFPSPADRARIVRPLKLAGVLGAYNIFVLVRGGGTTGQSGAVAHGIAKGVVAHVPEVDTVLRRAKLLRRDPRMVERKKTGMAKARKRYTWVKR
ncbi:hypothetical protein EW146_g7818 [Bondarzewia mesenterica]|uniref:fructose-bisphosphate aldolase n=1 Tax=Bondarzewia mesenterica TaxID=1095465 RepID=A0A4S4LJU6_9AGAM|nr:hypothetical protein EW146_g7818 [Bondarzewia mesenterica]